MSHTLDMGLRIKNLDALRRACVTLGVEMVQKSTFKQYSGERSGCQFAIRVPGNSQAYEAGVAKNQDGTYSVLGDDFMGGYGLVAKIGKDADLLKREFQIEIATEQRQNEGWQVTREEQEDGEVFLRCHR